MVRMVTEGYSWSGHERNVAYLNTRDGRFGMGSHVTNLNFKDDGRALGIVDWDQDGALDLWFRNRTAPRLRLMRNRVGGASNSLSLRLRSASGNRDAIGAVVTILTDQGPLLRSVRAGELFLSQSSKWLHVGLEGQVVEGVEVLWPGGVRESFDQMAAGGRYELVRGTGKAVQQAVRIQRPVLSEAANSPTTDPGGQARVLLPVRLPMPLISYRDSALKPEVVRSGELMRLLVLWSARCEHCQSELPRLMAGHRSLQEAGVEVLALCVDQISESEEAYPLMDGLV